MDQGSAFSPDPDEPKAGRQNAGCVRAVVALVIFAGIMALAAFGGGLVCYFLPREFYSRALLEVKPAPSGQSLEANPALRPARDPNFQATQLRIIQSKEVLYFVIHELKLAENWGVQGGQSYTLPKEETYARLLAMLKLETVRNTDLIEIGVYSLDRNEAANIANMTAIAYERLLFNDQRRRGEALLDGLRNEVATQRQAVAKASVALKQIEESRTDPKPNPTPLEVKIDEPNQLPNQNFVTPIPVSDEQCEAAKTGYLKAKRLLEAAEARLATETVQLKMTAIPVKIWERAEPALRPAKPDCLAVIVTGLNIGLAAGVIGAGLFLFFTRKRRLTA